MPNATSAVSANGDSFQAFPKGGRIRRVELVVDRWTEFDPQRVDLYRLHVPVLAAGRIVYTSSSDFPAAAGGSVVTPAQLALAPTYLPGIWTDCYDTVISNPVRFLFALVDAPAGTTAAILAEAAAS